METANQSSDLFEERPKGLPGMLNVLTILTFIGCGIAYLGGIYGFISSSDYEKQLAEMEKLRDQSGENSFAYKILEGSIDIAQKSYEYRYVMLASTLVFTTLCLIGALQMRKLKKSGFTIYTIGELAPLILTSILIGFTFFGSITIFLSAIIAVLFVVLYATQRKHLIH